MRRKGFRQPKPTKTKLYYKAEMVKTKGKIMWQAIEMPTKSIIIESFFEEDIKKLVKFQNQNKTFGKFGFPKFFDVRTIDERKKDKGKSDYIVR